MKKILTAAFLFCLIIACGSAKLMPVSADEAAKAAQRNPNVTLASLQEGQDLFRNNCQKCHGLKAPSSRTEKEWNQIIPRMSKKAKIDAKTEASITQYLCAFSKI